MIPNGSKTCIGPLLAANLYCSYCAMQYTAGYLSATVTVKAQIV